MDIFNLEKSHGERDLGLFFASRSFPILTYIQDSIGLNLPF